MGKSSGKSFHRSGAENAAQKTLGGKAAGGQSASRRFAAAESCAQRKHAQIAEPLVMWYILFDGSAGGRNDIELASVVAIYNSLLCWPLYIQLASVLAPC